ncbi:aryl-alcohol dehydrogenase-like predicted oxidoreductase [Babesia caballi]|uniref:Aryl-alcohol dehydrogenase-like predicted oxidoreductase n=1 Tax=Babesia caballi TaxID=5871 RepID=A0AAV4LWG2_BABCB|nr:aryl-alcohol dehydrogenase-like predicted oxidoreductase [Babesia caballi]
MHSPCCSALSKARQRSSGGRRQPSNCRWRAQTPGQRRDTGLDNVSGRRRRPRCVPTQLGSACGGSGGRARNAPEEVLHALRRVLVGEVGKLLAAGEGPAPLEAGGAGGKVQRGPAALLPPRGAEVQGGDAQVAHEVGEIDLASGPVQRAVRAHEVLLHVFGAPGGSSNVPVHHSRRDPAPLAEVVGHGADSLATGNHAAVGFTGHADAVELAPSVCCWGEGGGSDEWTNMGSFCYRGRSVWSSAETYVDGFEEEGVAALLAQLAELCRVHAGGGVMTYRRAAVPSRAHP